ATLLGEFRALARFTDPRVLVAYVGFYPVITESGERVATPHLAADDGAGTRGTRCTPRSHPGSTTPPLGSSRAYAATKSSLTAPRSGPARQPRSTRGRARRSPATGSPGLCSADCGADGRDTAAAARAEARLHGADQLGGAWICC